MKEDMQKKIIQYQVIEANLKTLQERAEALSARVEEIHGTKLSIEELKRIKPSDALIPLGSGNFVSGKIENTEDVIVGVGGGIAIKKKRDDAIAILDSTLKESEKELDDLRGQMTMLALQLEKLQVELEKMQSD